MEEKPLPAYTEKQQQIISAAERLFASKGFDGTSVREIAQEAGVNLAMISYYFGSKEKLLEAIFDERIIYFRTELESVINDPKIEPLKKVYQLLDKLVDRNFERSCFHRIMIREQIDSPNKNEFIQKMILESKKRTQELVKKIIHEGQEKGVFKKNIDISLMMMTLFGTINQMTTTQHFYQEINGLQHLTTEELQTRLKKKLRIHIKTLFKAILTNEN
ncbi:MAG: TetR family transcriptional regulator [Bacteroidota bacterium]